MPKPGKPKKDFQKYLCAATKSHVSHNDYVTSPATAFLKYTIEAKSAVDLCVRKFPTNKDGSYSSDSLDSLQHVVTAMLPALMGHFETFQKYLFAGIFDITVFHSTFDVNSFVKAIPDNKSITIDFVRLSAFRNIGTSSIGNLVADSLGNWHDPYKVNSYFKAFVSNHDLYSNESAKQLKVLWQLRHSIVHTGGTITLPDAQKIKELRTFGNQNIAFENNFIYEVSRKMHPIVKRATEGMGNAFKQNLIPNLTPNDKNKIDKLFEVKSSIKKWLD